MGFVGGMNNLHLHVQLGCLRGLVSSLPMQITMGQNQITKNL